MSDSAASFPPDILAALPAGELLAGVFAASLTGLALYRPIRAAEGGEIIDFHIELLSSKAQQMLGQPARPTENYLYYYPHTLETGVFAFHCDAFERGEPARMDVNYQADGLDNYFLLSAQRVGKLLLVSFTDTADHTRSAVEIALRESQARERAALAEAERQRRLLHDTFMQAPAMICILAGPNHVFELANPAYQALVGERPLLGRSIREAMPELEGQPIFGLLDRVYASGETFWANEMLVQLDHENEGRRELEKRYYNFVYQARRGPDGRPDGIMVFAYDVTTQVEAHHRTEASEQHAANANEELAAANEELQAANEEIRANNDDLFHAQLAVRELNMQLEMRVSQRTVEVQAARAEAERQRARLHGLFMQAPAAICILDGPDLVFELVNPAYQQLFPGRELLGRPLLTALPELAGHAVWRTFQEVFETGKTHQEIGMLIPIARYDNTPLEDAYFDYIQQARFDSEGGVDGMLVFAFEVTEQVRVRQQLARTNEELTMANQQASAHNQELAQANQQLQRTNSDLDNFVYAASHDLKQPINNLVGLFNELRYVIAFTDPEEEALLIPMLEEALAQLSTTVEDLAAVGQVQRDVNLPAETVLLDELTQEVLQTLQPQVQAARARITTDFAAAPTITYSRANLRTILVNLLSNSIKYADPARRCRIHLSLWKQDGRPVLLVEDNGLGFDVQRHQEELFQLFRRFHNHTEGTGVGLYLINRIVQGNGGRIEVESEIGEGSTFRLFL
ncbi:PAS domain-containing protein [Hymenobacter negativus]|uniref:histidine kinase n=1 Tax=Hymenobacter negativus TaxID=2795026 RepID=A0ABS3QCK6_9BACT|nr:PAS domain-containing protein [Hymenobacter negativus]MBO2008968.1 PAS domain-containing protein [Hymenobacter negativus]